MADDVDEIRWRGPEELRPLLVPIDSVKRHPRNPRRGDVALVAESLEAYGQTRPIVGWHDGTDTVIIAGNHTWQGAQRLGWTHIAVVVDPAMSEDEALDYLLADNATADVATYDDEALISTLQRLQGQGRLAGTGFTPDDLDDLIASANQIPDSVRREFERGHDDDDGGGARPPAPRPDVKQLVLSYDAEGYRRFTTQLQALAREYGTEGATATVIEAAEREFKEMWGE